MTQPNGIFRLYGDRISGNCYKVALILRLTGNDFEWVQTSVLERETRTPAFLELNPNGKVPALVFPDGRVVSESNALLLHFAEGTRWLPGDPFERALVYQWLFWEQYSHEPKIAVARVMVHFLKNAGEHPEKIRALWKGGHAALALMDKHLAGRSLLVGETFSIADIALYAYTHTAGDGGFDLSGYPNVTCWLERVTQQDGFLTMEEACQ